MKKLLMIVIILALSCGVGYTQEDTSVLTENEKVEAINEVAEAMAEAQRIYTKMYDSTVSIFSVSDEGLGICSGTVLTNNTQRTSVLTAKHCISTYEEVYVENVLVDFTITSTDDDIALLVMTKPILNKIPLTFAEADPKILEYVYHIGFPNFEEFPAYGKVWLKTNDHLYAKMEIIPGCSGGPVFNSDGDYVGVAWGSNGKTLAVFEPLSDVIRFLQTVYKF